MQDRELKKFYYQGAQNADPPKESSFQQWVKAVTWPELGGGSILPAGQVGSRSLAFSACRSPVM